MRLLEGKSVAMTGGGGGLGRCYGVAMAKAGASVAVCDIDVKAAQATVDARTARQRRCRESRGAVRGIGHGDCGFPRLSPV